VQSVYGRDSAQRGYAATAAVIFNLAKVLLIKDEVYVSYLLTRQEKKQRDITKYGVDVSNGDRIVYRHHTKPELMIGPWRLRFNITTRDWQLKLVGKMKWLRRLPGWHRKESAFRDWYVSLLDRVSLAGDAEYARGVEILRCAEEVTGYREIRYPKQDKVMVRVTELLGPGASTSSTNQDVKPKLEFIASGLRTAERV
jgi:indolepyruvate ferredoxin oxidoreductase